MPIQKFAGVTKIAPAAIEQQSTTTSLREAAFAYEMQILDLQTEIAHRQAKLRADYLARVEEIMGGAE